MRENYTLKRLYNESALSNGALISLPKDQVHYLATVLRMESGQDLRLFNGRDGEWLAQIKTLTKRVADIEILNCLRLPEKRPQISLAFAPVRRHRTAFIVEKGTELGVAAFSPILTARTQFPKLNLEKAKLQIIEAAEQTERLDIPRITKPEKLLDWLSYQKETPIFFADEAGDAEPVLKAITAKQGAAIILIGPEGGFTEEERTALRTHESVVPISLGPRILRADTAALSVLTLWQAVQGDWSP